MIISHQYRFIFIKTKKTAGTSLEVFLSQQCDENDVFTPIFPHVEPHIARNYSSLWNPIPEWIQSRGQGAKALIKSVMNRKRFYNHMPAQLVRNRISKKIWDSYYKFAVERNPWDKVMSHYHMINGREDHALSLDDYLQRGSLNYCLNYPLYTDQQGKPMIDRLVKYESLNDELGEIFDQLDIPFDGTLSVKAKSGHRKTRKNYRDVLTQQQKEHIDAAFAKEIEMHGYIF